MSPEISDRAADALKVGAGAAGTAVADATVGLDRAWEAAGGVLDGIFGGFPAWMDPGEIVDAVTGTGGGEAAGQIVPLALDAVAYLAVVGGMA